MARRGARRRRPPAGGRPATGAAPGRGRAEDRRRPARGAAAEVVGEFEALVTSHPLRESFRAQRCSRSTARAVRRRRSRRTARPPPADRGPQDRAGCSAPAARAVDPAAGRLARGRRASRRSRRARSSSISAPGEVDVVAERALAAASDELGKTAARVERGLADALLAVFGTCRDERSRPRRPSWEADFGVRRRGGAARGHRDRDVTLAVRAKGPRARACSAARAPGKAGEVNVRRTFGRTAAAGGHGAYRRRRVAGYHRSDRPVHAPEHVRPGTISPSREVDTPADALVASYAREAEPRRHRCRPLRGCGEGGGRSWRSPRSSPTRNGGRCCSGSARSPRLRAGRMADAPRLVAAVEAMAQRLTAHDRVHALASERRSRRSTPPRPPSGLAPAGGVRGPSECRFSVPVQLALAAVCTRSSGSGAGEEREARRLEEAALGGSTIGGPASREPALIRLALLRGDLDAATRLVDDLPQRVGSTTTRRASMRSPPSATASAWRRRPSRCSTARLRAAFALRALGAVPASGRSSGGRPPSSPMDPRRAAECATWPRGRASSAWARAAAAHAETGHGRGFVRGDPPGPARGSAPAWSRRRRRPTPARRPAAARTDRCRSSRARSERRSR